MTRITSVLCGLVLLTSTGCQRGPQSSVHGEAGQELTVTVPETVTLHQGNTAKFSVTVTRKKIGDAATVKIEGLPKGIAVKEGKFDFGEGINHQFVTLEATEDVPPQKDVAALVTATAGKYTAAAKLKIHVIESLESKAASKKAFAAEIEGRLATVKSELEKAKVRVQGSKSENNTAVFLKQISDRYEALADARGYYEKMLATPVEVWEREKDEVVTAVTNVERTTQALLTELKTLKD